MNDEPDGVQGQSADEDSGSADKYKVALFDLPEYVEAYRKFLSDSMHGMAGAENPVLGKMPRMRVGRAYRGRNSVGSSGSVESPVVATRGSYSLTYDTIVNCDVDEVLVQIHGLAEDYAATVIPQLYAGIGDIAQAFGNSTDAGGAPFTWDMVIDMYERVEMPFDDNDQPILPTLHVNPSMQIPEMSPEQQMRLNGILEQKRLAYLAGRRRRQLSRHAL